MEKRIKRLDDYLRAKNVTPNQAEVMCGLAGGVLSKARTGSGDIGIKTIEKIMKVFTDLNRVWLIAGEGEMLKERAVNVVENTTNSGSITQTAHVSEARLEVERLKAEVAVLREQNDKLLELLAGRRGE